MSDQRDGNNIFTRASAESVAQDVNRSMPQNHQMGQNVMTIQQAFTEQYGVEIPVESVTLPSRGKVYGGALLGRESLNIRAMTTREEDILTSTALMKNGTMVTQLVRSCLVDKNIDVNQLISADLNAIMMACRITGYGTEYEVTVRCPDCEQQVDHEFDLSRIGLKMLDVDPVVEHTNVFSFTLPRCRKVVEFKLMTALDELNYSKLSENRKKLAIKNNSLGETNVSDLLKSMIVSVDGKTEQKYIFPFIDHMPSYDSQKLRDYIKKMSPGIEMNQEFECRNCGHKADIEVPMTAKFLYPNLK